MGTLLSHKNAVVYGASGGIGGAVARAFVREGTTVLLTGRDLKAVEAVAEAIRADGGKAEAAQVDALDEAAIEKHLGDVEASVGRIDISFNAVGIPTAKILGVPLATIDAERFSLPITTYTMSYFLTARLAARHMIPHKSGVIMTVTTTHSRASTPLVGGYGPAQAAKETLTRDPSAESVGHVPGRTAAHEKGENIRRAGATSKIGLLLARRSGPKVGSRMPRKYHRLSLPRGRARKGEFDSAWASRHPSIPPWK